ncbi:MAG: alpha/beta fold hydrolase [Chloroflexi bacterium]|nr:alpha/beta fold hydrolase [Chloroflexota bacterium]
MQRFRLTPKLLAVTFGSLVVVLIVAVLGISWYYSVQIEDGVLAVKHDPTEYDVEVIALEDDRVRLVFPTEEDLLKQPGTIGFDWPGGYARTGETLEVDGVEALREYTELEGSLTVGDQVHFDKYAFPGDPERAHGISFENIKFPSPVGNLDAWKTDGSDDTWVIFVHGKGAKQGEALRMLAVAEAADFPTLTITYRNDAGMPDDPSAYYWYGLTEWEDLEAAARYALDNGAADLIVVGYSMGGGIVANFMYQSPLADQVVGVILDSPMLDPSATIDLAADNRNLPSFLTAIAKSISGVRFDIDWRKLDYLNRADEISVPILLFHGDADEKVPVSISERLAKSRPDIVTYEFFEDAPHVGAWNVDPDRYEAAVREFVVRVAR